MSTRNAITTKAIQQAFAVSHMTVHAWRKGTPSKDPLPVIETGTRDVLFKPADVKRWAKAHKIDIVDAKALDPSNVDHAKPGPKAKAKAVVKAATQSGKKSLAKIIAGAKKPLPRPGEKGYVAPKRKAVRASSVDKAEGRARGYMAI